MAYGSASRECGCRIAGCVLGRGTAHNATDATLRIGTECGPSMDVVLTGRPQPRAAGTAPTPDFVDPMA